MYYAFFQDNGNSLDLYDIIDALAKGEKVDLPLTVRDLEIKNIYLSDKKLRALMLCFLYRFRKYYNTINELLIPADPNTIHTQDIRKKVNQIIRGQEDYLKKKYEDKDNWAINKQLFFDGGVSKYNCLVNAMTQLFFCFGCIEGNAFDNLYRFVSSAIRMDYQNPRDKKKKQNQLDTIANQLKNNSEIQSLLKDVKLYSMNVYINQNKVFREVGDLKTNIIDPTTDYMQMNIAKDALLKYICQCYYDFGVNERRKNRPVGYGKQVELNKIQFSGKTGGVIIKKSDVNTHCKTCGRKSSYIYDFIAYAPFEYTLASVCPSCFENTTYLLNQEWSSKFTNYNIVNQMVVTYNNYHKSHGKCSCCGRITKACFKIISIRNQQIDICKDCFGKLANNADRKLKRLQKEGM